MLSRIIFDGVEILVVTCIFSFFDNVFKTLSPYRNQNRHFVIKGQKMYFQNLLKQEEHDGPVSLHWLIRKIPSCQALQ